MTEMIRICPRLECQMLYSNTDKDTLCPHVEEDALNTIKDLLSNQPYLSALDIHRETGIPMHIFNALIASGRLTRIESQDCHRCGAPLEDKIRDSRLCPGCMNHLRKQLSAMTTKTQTNVIPLTPNWKASCYGLSSRQFIL